MLAQNSRQKSEVFSGRVEINILLKRKLAIGVNIKVVALIIRFHKSGKRTRRTIPTKSYARYKISHQKWQRSNFQRACYIFQTILIFIVLDKKNLKNHLGLLGINKV